MAPRSIERVIDIIQDKSYLDEITGCYVWTGCLNDKGYGKIAYWRRQWLVHRLIYVKVMFKPEEDLVRHTCDTPACWCPDHLIGGTQAQNIADMIEKGRQNKGSAHPRAVLTEEAVREIRASSLSNKELGAKFNIHYTAIHRVRLGITWKHI
jgi:hypothetical protein